MGQLGQLHHLRRNAHGLPVGDVKGHHTDHRRHGTPLAVGVDPEAGQMLHGEGKIVIADAAEVFHIPSSLGINLLNQILRRLGAEALLPQADQPVIQLLTHWTSGYEEQVRRAVLHRAL